MLGKNSCFSHRNPISCSACNSHINPSSPSQITHYVIVRSDLPLGFLAAQVVHAAGESSPGNLDPGTRAVVLAVMSEAALAVIERQLHRLGVRHTAIREPDPPYDGALTAIGISPLRDRSVLRPLLSRLPLLGRKERAA